MTDSPEDLTESVYAPGKKLEGGRAKCSTVEILQCDLCQSADKRQIRIENRRQRRQQYPELWTDEREYYLRCDERLEERYIEHIAKVEAARRPRSKNRYALGPREFTLTYSTKWFANDVEARLALTNALNKLIKYYKDEITKLRAVGEVGKNGASHIHCYYELNGGRKITDKNFKRAWPYWDPSKKHGNGFQGGHHAEVKSTADFLGYIDKEIDSAWLETNIDSTHTHAED